jgi:hypothetical protein
MVSAAFWRRFITVRWTGKGGRDLAKIFESKRAVRGISLMKRYENKII